MATEIERKFLLCSDRWRDEVSDSTHYRQGYLGKMDKASVRVRIEGQQAFLNIKSATLGVTRSEYQYAIPLEDAKEMLDSLCGGLVEKVRHKVLHGDHCWEIDEFGGNNAGLIVAEVELRSEDEAYARPDWLGEEVSDDPRYYNVNLVNHPYKEWE